MWKLTNSEHHSCNVAEGIPQRCLVPPLAAVIKSPPHLGHAGILDFVTAHCPTGFYLPLHKLGSAALSS